MSKKPAKEKAKPSMADAPFHAPAWPASKTETWPLAKIIPYQNNARTHPPAQISLLAELMKKRGVDQPIVVDENGIILKGHGRRLAAIEAGFEEFPVAVHRGLSETEKRAIRIEDNQIALLSGWNQDLIRHELAELKLSNYPLELLGFGESQLVTFQTTLGPPAEFKSFGENIPTKYCCPKCGFAWSGNAGGKDEPAVNPKTDEKSTKRTNKKSDRRVTAPRSTKTSKKKTRRFPS